MPRQIVRFLLFFILSIGFSGCERQSKPKTKTTVTVFAAASTTTVLNELLAKFSQLFGVECRSNFAASSTLAQQIQAGAPCDIFLSANEQWMDKLESKSLLAPHSRQDLLGNRLVLIGAPTGAPAVSFDKSFAIDKAFPGRLAIGDPAHVPAGIYAKQALEKLDWWQRLADRMIMTMDVRDALRLVEQGEAQAGIVYSTDAADSKKVSVLGTFPEDTHEPIRYPIAICKNSRPEASRLLEFLTGPEAAAVFERYGFIVLHSKAK